jgi:hypothetical protein
MAEAQRITDPGLLSDTTVGLSGHNVEVPRRVTLVLLQPLAKPEVLAACRHPKSSLIHNTDDAVFGAWDYEYLDIRPLSVLWRQAVREAAPISDVTFDLSMPKGDKGTKLAEKVYWDISMPQGGIGVISREVMSMVITLATGIRMRVGGDLRFGIIYDERDGMPSPKIARLESQLLALAKYKAPGKVREQIDQNVAD